MILFDKRKGFTLMESIVVVGIFVIVVLTVINLYLIYSKAQRQANQRQKILNEVSYLIEKISREIRLNDIIYGGTFAYRSGVTSNLYSMDSGEAGINGREVELAINSINAEDRIYYIFDDGSHVACGDGLGLYKFTGDFGNCQKMFDIDNIRVQAVGFYISPSHNPYPSLPGDCETNSFDGNYCLCPSGNDGDCFAQTYSGVGDCVINKCRQINIQPLVTLYISIKDSTSNKEMTFQTTVSSRIYKR